ncbi:GtrA family protein [Arthrobacter sp. NPDC058288]|uniref:GtrA family protein n=1 Tax=Arthrobacter sp. NPDC058288 TaxID=3346424 RepID=UPI0036EEED22
MASHPPAADEPVRGIHSGPPGPLMKIVKDQRVAFLLVGGANTAFSTGLFIVLALAFPQAPSFILLSASWTISLIAVFFVYRKLVFRVKGHVWLDLGRFALVNLTSLLVNIGLLSVFADLLHFPRIPTQLAITLLSVIISYFGHRHFSFRRKHSPEQAETATISGTKEEETA